MVDLLKIGQTPQSKIVNTSRVKIFANDTKAYKAINDDNDVLHLQTAIDAMFEWTQKWLLQFNKQKCKILHLGRNNPKHNYIIGKDQEKVTLNDRFGKRPWSLC